MSQISISNFDANPLFLFGLLIYYYLNIPFLKKIVKEFSNEKSSSFSNVFNVLFTTLKFQVSNENISDQNIISITNNKKPIISHLNSKSLYINTLSVENNTYFKIENAKPDGEYLFIEDGKVYYGNYEYNFRSLYDIYKFSKDNVKPTYPTNQLFILIKNPEFYQDSFSIINQDSSEERSQYIYVLVNNEYKKFDFPLHLWDRLEKSSKTKSNIIKIIYNYACFNSSSEILSDDIYNSLYTSSLKNKFILISNQISINYGKTDIDNIIQTAKNIFKLICSKEEVLNVLSYKKRNIKQDIVSEDSIQNFPEVIKNLQKSIENLSEKSNQNKQQIFIKNLPKKSNQNTQQISIQNLPETSNQNIPEKLNQNTQQKSIQNLSEKSNQNIHEKLNQNTQQKSIQNLPEKSNQNTQKILHTIKLYMDELLKLKNINKIQLNKKFKDLIKDQFIEEKKNYKYDPEFLKSYKGLEILPKIFINKKKHSNIDRLKTINEFEIIYLLYIKYLNITNKTDNDIYQLNICIDYIQKNLNIVIKCVEDVFYIPFKKWIL